VHPKHVGALLARGQLIIEHQHSTAKQIEQAAQDIETALYSQAATELFDYAAKFAWSDSQRKADPESLQRDLNRLNTNIEPDESKKTTKGGIRRLLRFVRHLP
jgi:hypothetical protein